MSILKGAQGNQLIVEVWSNYQTQEEAAAAQKSGGGGKKKGKSGSFMTGMVALKGINNLTFQIPKFGIYLSQSDIFLY